MPDFSKPMKGWEPPAPSKVQILKAIDDFKLIEGEDPAAVIMGPLMADDCFKDSDDNSFGIPVIIWDNLTTAGIYLVKKRDIGIAIDDISVKTQEEISYAQHELINRIIRKYTMEAAKPFKP